MVLALSSPVLSSAKEKQEYYPGGRLKSKVNIVDGKWEGSHKSYYENGQLEGEGNYANGKMIGQKAYYETGKKQ